jgi:hypothetical protein
VAHQIPDDQSGEKQQQNQDCDQAAKRRLLFLFDGSIFRIQSAVGIILKMLTEKDCMKRMLLF